MSTPKIAIVHFTYKKYSDGTSPVMIRITANRKSRYMTTGYSVKTENWDEENNRFLETKNKLLPDKKPLSNAKAINADIEHQLSDVIRVKQQVSLTEGVQTSKRIKEKANSKYTESANFIEYAKELAKKIMTQDRIRSSNNYSSVIRHIEEFQDGTPLLFSDITTGFINAYQAFLLKSRKNNTVNTHLSIIRSILHQAINEDEPLFSQDKNPFNKIKLKKSPTQKESLSFVEIEKLRKAKLKAPAQQRLINVRNYYLFSYNNAGIRISDLIHLKIKNIVDDRLHYEMGKTGHFKSIKLNAESKAIIKQYKKRDAKPDDYLFPVLSNEIDYSDILFLRKQVESKASMINGDLKKLAKAAKLNKRLHFHSSRHSFTNIARQKKADLYSISKALGHASLKATEAYLASFDEEALDETMEMVLGK